MDSDIHSLNNRVQRTTFKEMHHNLTIWILGLINVFSLIQEGTCETLRLQERIKIDAFAFVPKYNNSALKRAIAKYGPACVSINQKPLSLKFYSWGIYDNPECGKSV